MVPARAANMKLQQLHVDYVIQTAFHVYQHQPLIALLVAYYLAHKVTYSPVTINAITIALEQLIS